VVERAKKDGPIVVVDGGGALAPRTPMQDAERDQRLKKAELIAEAWALTGIDAVALSSSDWNLGRENVQRIVKDHRVPVLAANLTCDGEAPYPGTTVIERGGLRMGIVGVTDGKPSGCEVTDPIAAARSALAEIGPVDVTLALVPMHGTAIEQWASADLPIDLVLDGSGRHDDTPRKSGRAWSLSAGSRGKWVGVATLTMVPGGSGWSPGGVDLALKEEIAAMEKRIVAQRERISETSEEKRKERLLRGVEKLEKDLDAKRRELDAWKTQQGPVHHAIAVTDEELSSQVNDHPATRALVEQALAGITSLEQGGAPVPADAPHLARVGSAYAGSDACQGCHAPQHAQWSSTPHAHAYRVLVEQERAMDRDCYGCHVTGEGTPGGPTSPASVGGLRDVQCEACHGPAAEHARSPNLRPPLANPTEAACTGCHDGQRDEGRFDYAAYRPKIVH
jgi:hypothetical protein